MVFRDGTLNRYYEALRTSRIQASSVENSLKDFSAMLIAASELEDYVRYSDNNCISGVLDAIHKALDKEMRKGDFPVEGILIVNTYSGHAQKGLDGAKIILNEIHRHIESKYSKEESTRCSIEKIVENMQ